MFVSLFCLLLPYLTYPNVRRENGTLNWVSKSTTKYSEWYDDSCCYYEYYYNGYYFHGLCV